MTVPPAPAPEEPPRRRTTELLLLVLACGIVLSALTIVELNQERTITLGLVTTGLPFLALFLGAHLVVRRFAPYADPIFLPAVAFLNGIGLVMIHRLDLGAAKSAEFNGWTEPSPIVLQQVMWTLIGVVAFAAAVILLRDHRLLARYSYTLGLLGLVALAIPALLPASMSEVNGAKIWIRLFGVSIQPGEFAKILLLVFMANLLVEKRELFQTAGRRFLGMDFPRARDLAPVLAFWAVAVLIMVFETDLGSALLIFGTVLAMIYVATARASWVIIGLAMFFAGAAVAYQLFGHVKVRVQTWLDPFATYDTTGFQLSNSLMGLGSGGLGGTGLGNGQPNLTPFANTDFIIAALGEELGLFGLAAILLVFVVIISRGMRVAMQVRDSFGKLLAAGLAFTIMVQLFVVVGGVTRLIPLTGLTTPFVSYGGSSLLANYILVGILLKISHDARKPVFPRRSPQPLTNAPTQAIRAVGA